MKLREAFAAISVAAMTIAPVAAQAGTAASSSVPSMNSSMGMRASSGVAKKDKLNGADLVLVFVALGAGGYGIYEATKNDKSDGAS
jgi:hypothetical protein